MFTTKKINFDYVINLLRFFERINLLRLKMSPSTCYNFFVSIFYKKKDLSNSESKRET